MSPTANGNEEAVENPTDNLTVTSLLESLYSIPLIPTPLLFSIGIIVGVELLIPLVFCNIVTVLSETEYLKSKSEIISPVFPSNANNSGDDVYPLAIDETVIESTTAEESTFITWGSDALGFNVLSEGKSYPTSFTWTVSIFPIFLLMHKNSAFDPFSELTETTSGKEV